MFNTVLVLLIVIQSPTIYELVAHEKGFALIVEELFSNITFPEYRQMIIEVIIALQC